LVGARRTKNAEKGKQKEGQLCKGEVWDGRPSRTARDLKRTSREGEILDCRAGKVKKKKDERCIETNTGERRGSNQSTEGLFRWRPNRKINCVDFEKERGAVVRTRRGGGEPKKAANHYLGKKSQPSC